MIAKDLLERLNRATYDDLLFWFWQERPEDAELATALEAELDSKARLFQPEALSMISRMMSYYIENPEPKHVEARRARRPW